MNIAREEKLAELDRVLHGRALHGSDNLKAFLRFIVDKSLENQEGQLKEYVIATEVFGRGSDFDSRVDSVVRVQAGRLRTKLHEYYENEGRDDRVIIILPKGQYTPVFSYAEKREERDSDGETGADAALVTDAVSNPKEASDIAQSAYVNGSARDAAITPANGVVTEAARVIDPAARRWRVATLALILMSVALGALAFIYRARAVELETVARRAQGGGDAIDRREVEPLWGDLLRSQEPILVVYSNTLFQGTAEEGMKLFKSLDAPGSSLARRAFRRARPNRAKSR
jgi:hypothetical protein